jgi:N-succinyldiaminopimelate aminotransferase
MSLEGRLSHRWCSIGESIFTEMTMLAKAHHALNLGQGFPDFYGPQEVIQAISEQVLSCHNQYAPSAGEEPLRKQIASYIHRTTGVLYDSATEITITTGASEAIYSAINAFVNPGDKVILFEPAFDLYYQAIANAGGVVVPVRLHAPDTPVGIQGGGWSLDWSEFDAAVSSGFSLMIFNSPHNPTGKVFTEEERERIAHAILKHNAIVISDEVYENLVYDDRNHVSLVTQPKIKHLVVRVSSAAKTFGFTGLKVGWVSAPAPLTKCVRLVHQATVFCVSPFTQLGIAQAMSREDWFVNYLDQQKQSYQDKRNFLVEVLKKAGFDVCIPQGTFFITANFEKRAGDISALEYARTLVKTERIATIPLSPFYQNPPKSLPWLRFAFCKTQKTLDLVAREFLHP